MSGVIEILLLVVVALVTYCVAGEGAWGAAITLLSVILSGLIAMNFFEPICNNLLGGNSYWQERLDLIVLGGLFTLGVFGFRAAADYVSPTYIGVHRYVHESARWGCAVLTGYVTIAFLLTALHTAPLPREFAGFRPERANFFGLSPDRQWLGFMQFVSEGVCSSNPPRIFDGPQIDLGDPEPPGAEKKNKIWPSFPIRYATRRERGGAAAASAPASPPQVQPQKSGGTPAF
jgi:hypothetical protein